MRTLSTHTGARGTDQVRPFHQHTGSLPQQLRRTARPGGARVARSGKRRWDVRGQRSSARPKIEVPLHLAQIGDSVKQKRAVRQVWSRNDNPSTPPARNARRCICTLVTLMPRKSQGASKARLERLIQARWD